MRTYTLACSIIVHLLALGAMVLTPLLANDVLPEPRRAFEFISVAPAPPPPPPPAPRRATREAPRTNRDAAPIHPPDAITPEPEFERFEITAATDEHGVLGGDPGIFATTSLIDDPPPPPPPPTSSTRPRPVGGVIKRPERIRDVAPIYPAIAQASRVQGVVILEAVIGDDGRVRNLRVLRSIRLLDQAAIDAVRQWQFTPTLLNGEPVPVVMTVTVAFTLNR